MCFVDLAKRFKRRNADGGGQIAEGGSGNSQPPIEISPSLRHTPLLVFLAAATILNIVIFSKWTIWWGGHSFGYRMLIEIIPALTVFLAVAWHRWFSRRWYGIVLFLLLLLPSLFIHYLGFRYYPSDWNVNPINTDFAKERMWDWQDTELTRLYKRFESDWFPEETKPPG